MIDFEWDPKKNFENQLKHGIAFETAIEALTDPGRIIAHDSVHSLREPRWFCIGKAGGTVVTVRFTYRNGKIRIIGAGAWRKGRKYYEEN